MNPVTIKEKAKSKVENKRKLNKAKSIPKNQNKLTKLLSKFFKKKTYFFSLFLTSRIKLQLTHGRRGGNIAPQ
jgi:hypothetical protein